MAPPPPLPDQLKRAGIPIIGGLSLVGTMGCGRALKTDDEYLGSWNMIQLDYYGYSQSTPYAYSYEAYGQSCVYFGARDLEIDSTTSGRFVVSYGYIGCGGDMTQTVTQGVSVEIRSDGVLELTLTGGGGNTLDETGGAQDEVITCERDGALLACSSPAGIGSLVFARPACSSSSQCSGAEMCIARQCVVPTDGGDVAEPVPETSGATFTSGGFEETGDGGFGETGP